MGGLSDVNATSACETELRGPHGRGWFYCPARTETEQLASIAAWLLQIPGPYRWDHYLVSMIVLRPLPWRTTRPFRAFPEATHELLVSAVSSDHGPPDRYDSTQMFAMRPVNYRVHLVCPDDRRAILLSRQFAELLLKGDLPAEPGQGREHIANHWAVVWIEAQLRTRVREATLNY